MPLAPKGMGRPLQRLISTVRVSGRSAPTQRRIKALLKGNPLMLGLSKLFPENRLCWKQVKKRVLCGTKPGPVPGRVNGARSSSRVERHPNGERGRLYFGWFPPRWTPC